jgi:high-affinity nickel permease
MEGALTQGATLLAQLLMGVSLAACAGLRAFLPLFAVGLAGRLEILPLTRSFEWLSSWPALIVFAVAVVFELLADKFPLVDNFLDTVQAVVKPIAGMILVTCVLTELSPLQATVLGLVLGGSAAAAVHLSKAQVRVASTASTAGIANPVLSVLEDAGALVGTIVSFLLPGLVLVMLVAFLVWVWLVIRRMRRRAERTA